jgi:tetratricopeptide (TPR) repeat protein
VELRLALTRAKLGRWAEAEPLLEHVYRVKQATGANAGDWSAPANYGVALAKLGKHAQAEPILREAEAAMRAYSKMDRATMYRVASALGESYDALNRPEDAAAYRAIAEEMKASLATRPSGRPGNAAPATGPS